MRYAALAQLQSIAAWFLSILRASLYAQSDPALEPVAASVAASVASRVAVRVAA
jgi:hypothetical protein